MARLLVVEDDERVATPLVRSLELEGFSATHVTTGDDALHEVTSNRPDLVLLDLTLPDVDGLDVCRRIRETDPGLPIVMLTARSEEVDLVVGFAAGADDYVAKPFRVGELIARVRARLRAPLSAHRTPDKGVRVDTSARRAWIDDNELSLTPKEFELLAMLVREPGVLLTRERLMREIWSDTWWGSTRTLDTHIFTLRHKLGDDDARMIVTVRGLGFRFEGETCGDDS